MHRGILGLYVFKAAINVARLGYLVVDNHVA